VRSGPFRVIDTNVLLVANEQHENASPACVIECVRALESLRRTGTIAIDDEYEILREYARRTAPNTGNRVGDAFLKWAYQNSGNPDCVERTTIRHHPSRVYEEFPDDVELNDFDREDRKFVAVALSHQGHPPILQGTDSKWMAWSKRLSVHRIEVEFLCPGDIAAFLARKNLLQD
jgi:hypothetical protein